jgi:hypothetical protein
VESFQSSVRWIHGGSHIAQSRRLLASRRTRQPSEYKPGENQASN